MIQLNNLPDYAHEICAGVLVGSIVCWLAYLLFQSLTRKAMTTEELKKEIEKAMAGKPSCHTKGQFIYNYIDFEYGVAMDVKTLDGIDCSQDDTQIDAFLEHCAKRIKQR